MSDSQREATRMASALTRMLAEAAADAADAMRQARPDFHFLPIVTVTVVDDAGRALASNCEFPRNVPREQLSHILKTTANAVEMGPGTYTAFEVEEDDEPTTH